MEAVAKILLIGTGGFIGANVRYWLGVLMLSKLGDTFPWPSMIVNVTGSLVIGVFLGLASSLNWNFNWTLLVAVGVLGGYTTYSTFAYEAVRLLGNGQYVAALAYIEGTALLTVFAAWLGMAVARIATGGSV